MVSHRGAASGRGPTKVYGGRAYANSWDQAMARFAIQYGRRLAVHHPLPFSYWAAAPCVFGEQLASGPQPEQRALPPARQAATGCGAPPSVSLTC